MVNVTYLWLYSLKHTLNIQFNVAPTVRQSKNLNNAIITETELDTTVVKKRKIGGGGEGGCNKPTKGMGWYFGNCNQDFTKLRMLQ